MNAHPQSQGADMYHESFNILIQRRLSEFLSINDFDSTGSWKGFFGGVGSPGELFLSELDVSIAKGKEGHA